MNRAICILVILLAVNAEASAAPLKPPEWLPRYLLDMQFDLDGHTVRVAQKIVFTNHFKQSLDRLVFNVHSAYTPPQGTVDYLFLAKMLEIMRVPGSQGIYGQKACSIEKASVYSANEKNPTSVAFHFREDNECALEVPLLKNLLPGESVTVELQYTFRLPQRQGRWGQWKGVTFLSNWCPVVAIYDDAKGWQPTPFIAWHQPWFNEAGVFEARAILPKDQVVACSGLIKEEIVEGGNKEVHIGPVVSRDFAFLCSNRFETTTVESNGVRVKCVAFPEHEHYAKAIARISSQAIDQYSKWFGPFPYPELTIVESYFGWNGNECADLIMIDERVFDMPKLAEGYVEYLVSHETCHQWFYNTIGTDGYRETFMDEAFATYFAHRLLNGRHGRNNAMLEYPRELDWLPRIERENYRFSTFYNTLKRGELRPPLDEMQNYRHVGNLFAACYDRGSKIIGIIEDRLGENAFLEFMQVLYRKYYFKVLLAKDFQKELELFTGKSWDDFFDRWLYKAGMTDWAIDTVKIENVPQPKENENKPGPLNPFDPSAPPPTNASDPKEKPKPLYKATVVLQQKAEYNEPTQLGISFDGKTYPLRLAVGMVTQPTEIKDPPATVSPLPDNKVRVEFHLDREPKQMAVDPDQVLPDADPANNFWKFEPRIRLTPLYTFLDETTMTTDYDRWNITVGPWLYGPSYNDPWYTRSDVIGARAGIYRTETFNGGVYVGYRTDWRDIAVGFDATLLHWPDGKMEIGINGEKSLGQIDSGGTDLDRISLYERYIFTQASSLYTAPMHYLEGFEAWQRNFLPTPRYLLPGLVTPNEITEAGVHWHVDYLTPYWDPEVGAKLDLSYAVGLPVFGQATTNQVTGQLSGVIKPPEWTGWLSETKLAWRAWGAVSGPEKYALFSLGGSELFRGFDLNERQGNLGWIGSLEWRVPILTESRFSVFDQVVGLRNLDLAPFYDVGDMYGNGHSYGPPAQALGLGLRMDIAWFSFIERTTLRVDVAKTVNSAAPMQLWFGITQPF